MIVFQTPDQYQTSRRGGVRLRLRPAQPPCLELGRPSRAPHVPCHQRRRFDVLDAAGAADRTGDSPARGHRQQAATRVHDPHDGGPNPISVLLPVRCAEGGDCRPAGRAGRTRWSRDPPAPARPTRGQEKGSTQPRDAKGDSGAAQRSSLTHRPRPTAKDPPRPPRQIGDDSCSPWQWTGARSPRSRLHSWPLACWEASAQRCSPAQQVREARRSREAQMAAESFRRWNEDPLVQTRRMVRKFNSPEELRETFSAYVSADAPKATCCIANSTTSNSSARSSARALSTSS
jgi:hypothetical protein